MDYIDRGDALAVARYSKNPVEGIENLPSVDLVASELLAQSEEARADLGRRLAAEMQRKQTLPCKIGDEVWGIRNFRGKKHPQRGRVNEMFYRSDMSLLIVVKNICRGEWGKVVFPTYEAAMAAVERKDGEG